MDVLEEVTYRTMHQSIEKLLAPRDCRSIGIQVGSNEQKKKKDKHHLAVLPMGQFANIMKLTPPAARTLRRHSLRHVMKAILNVRDIERMFIESDSKYETECIFFTDIQ